MTGVEAVSNGVPAFRPPESKNAAADARGDGRDGDHDVHRASRCSPTPTRIVPNDTETVVSQIARATFGGRGWPYYVVQAATMAILVLAANTAYADFPRLASILARDRFLPRQFMNQGDRLAFSNGILILSVLASVLLVVFGGDTHALIPLYMIGVFVSFTLSQAGMVIHWRTLRDAGLADERRDQRVRRARDRRRADHRRDDEGRRGRVDHHRDDSGARDDLRDHPAALRSRRLRADAARLVAGAAGPARRAGADRRHPAGRGQGAAIRADAVDDVRAVYVEIDPAATDGGSPAVARMGAGRRARRARLARIGR